MSGRTLVPSASAPFSPVETFTVLLVLVSRTKTSQLPSWSGLDVRLAASDWNAT